MNNVITEFSFEELEDFVLSLGLKKFRACQIAGWIYKKFVTSFNEMTNLSKSVREFLDKGFVISALELVSVSTSRDGSRKYLFRLADGNFIESVFIPEDRWNTVCVSTQVGCPVGCTFCLTGSGNFKRNLSVSEIISQFIEIQKDVRTQRISNVVFMGMGEPLLNFDNVKKSVGIMLDEKMLNLSSRKITVSTCGIIPGINRMAEELNKVKLAVSLHTVDDELRSKLVPINTKYGVKDIIKSLERYPADNTRRIMIEYILFDGVNDSVSDALKLAETVKNLPVKVNIIPFNPYPGTLFKRPSDRKISAFRDALWRKNIAAFVRDSKGHDIFAACGMLATSSVRAS